MEQKNKHEISLAIKGHIQELNELLHDASKENLKVVVSQSFHPMSNSIGADLNAPLSATISETINY